MITLMELGHKTYHFSEDTGMKKELSGICEGGRIDESMEDGKGGGEKSSLVSTSWGLDIVDIPIYLDQPET